jgi:hypothetical protein
MELRFLRAVREAASLRQTGARGAGIPRTGAPAMTLATWCAARRPATRRILLLVAPALAAACAAPRQEHDPPAGRAATRGGDSAFAAVQERGADPRAMGVDQATSRHRFDALADGGRIELQRLGDDSAGVAQIRRHLRAIAAAFGAGDFSTPAFVHMREVPGTAVMAARRETIAYSYRDLARGGEVRITTRDPEALRAVHAFIAFQRRDHRAGGAGHVEHHP